MRARASTLGQYHQEQQAYRQRWAEHNQQRREAWLASRARHQARAQDHAQIQRQQASLGRLEERSAATKRQQATFPHQRARDEEMER